MPRIHNDQLFQAPIALFLQETCTAESLAGKDRDALTPVSYLVALYNRWLVSRGVYEGYRLKRNSFVTTIQNFSFHMFRIHPIHIVTRTKSAVRCATVRLRAEAVLALPLEQYPIQSSTIGQNVGEGFVPFNILPPLEVSSNAYVDCLAVSKLASRKDDLRRKRM